MTLATEPLPADQHRRADGEPGLLMPEPGTVGIPVNRNPSRRSTEVLTHTVDALVEENLPIASASVAAMLTRVPGWVRQDELYAAAVVGLFEAAQRWDPTIGVPFAAYARPRVKGAILDELRKGDWAPRSVRRTARAESEAVSQLGTELGRAPSDEELAVKVGISVEQLRQARLDATRAWTTPFLLGEYGDAEPAGLTNLAATPEQILLDRELHGYLADAIAALPERRAEVVRRYYLEGEEMSSIAADWGVTVSRVSQINSEAVELLRRGLTGVLDPDTVQDEAPPRRAALAHYQAQIVRSSSMTDRLSTPVARHDA